MTQTPTARAQAWARCAAFSPSLLRKLGDDMLHDALAYNGAPVLAYEAHPGQQLVHDSTARFRIMANARRWGKDRCGIQDVLRQAAVTLADPNRDPTLRPRFEAWFVYPTIPSAQQLWAELKASIPRTMLASQPTDSHYRISLKGDGVIRVRTAKDPSALVAVGLDFLVIGEAARVHADAWRNLRPTLDSPGRLGLAILSSVPMGRNWFYGEYLRGLSPDFPDWQSWNFPTAFVMGGDGQMQRHPHGNPHFTAERFRAIQEEWRESPRWFRQEYMAEFISGEGSAFENVRSCIAPPPARPEAPVVVGVDLGRRRDATVFCALDGQRRQVAIERLVQQPYRVQLRRLEEFIGEVNARLVVVESNGPGDPFIEELCHALQLPTRDPKEMGLWARMPGVEVVPFQTTAPNKRAMIEELALAFERGPGALTILDDPVQANELELFEYTLLDTGRVRYSGPDSAHDDCVMALALAHWPLVDAPRHEPMLAAVPDVEGGADWAELEQESYWRKF